MFHVDFLIAYTHVEFHLFELCLKTAKDFSIELKSGSFSKLIASIAVVLRCSHYFALIYTIYGGLEHVVVWLAFLVKRVSSK